MYTWRMSQIKKARKKVGLTQRALAEILDVSTETISHWETGKRSPSINRLRSICAVIPVTVRQLMDEKINKPWESS